MKKEMDNLGYGEDRTNYAGRKRRKGRSVLTVLALLTAMVAVVYVTVTVCAWLDERGQQNAVNTGGGSVVGNGGSSVTDGSTVSENDNALGAGGSAVKQDGSVPGEDGSVIGTSGGVMYSQEEIEHMVSTAVEEAQRQAVEEVQNRIKISLDEGDSLLQALRPLYPDEIIVYSDSKYHFVPINRELQLNDYRQENLNILETGEFQYLQDGEVVSYKGIDVSQYQGNIDWKQVADSGVDFAFIRAGFRGWGSSGRLVEDTHFNANMKGAVANGIKVGVYFYSQAISVEEAVEEANFVLERIAPYTVECPIVFDVETVTNADGRMNADSRMNALSIEDRTNYALQFCQTIENAGYKPMLYYNTEMGAVKLDVSKLEGYDKWFASYSDRLYYPYAYDVWQYSSTGSVPGIKGAVDLNISFVPLWE